MTDIHTKAASEIFNVPEDKVTKEMREKIIKKMMKIASKCECYNPETGSCSETLNLIKELDSKTQEYQNLSNLLHDTDIYSIVCMSCRDEILTYPSINGKTSYTDNEVDTITLKRIIDALRNKEQECEKLEKRLSNCIDCRSSNMLPPDCDELRIINNRYYKALEKIERICEKSSTEWEAYKDETCIFHCKTRKTNRAKFADKILNIINKAKGR